MLCILPPGNLGGKVRQLVPELIGQRSLVHVDRDSIGFAAAILHGGGVGHGIGEVHRFTAARCQGLDAVCGDDGGQLRHIRAAGQCDGNGIGGVVHRTDHTADGEAGDALGRRCGRLPLAGDGHIACRHGKAVACDLDRFTTCHRQRIGQGTLHHLIAAVRLHSDDDLIALIRLGAVGGNGAALGCVNSDGKLTGVRCFAAAAVGGDLYLQGSALASRAFTTTM